MGSPGHRPINSDIPAKSGVRSLLGQRLEVDERPSGVRQYRPLSDWKGLRRPPFEMGVEAPAPVRVRDAIEGSFGAQAFLELVIGRDDRIRVGNELLTTNPWRQICALRIRAQTGAEYVGTGWFIAPAVVATAGHCVYLHREGGWARSIRVIPAKRGSAVPVYGESTAMRFSAPDGWMTDASEEFDYGVIHLESGAMGEMVGNFEVADLTDKALTGAIARISGYPADRDQAEFQYYHERPFQGLTADRLFYDIDTFGGQSGSPIWVSDGRGGVTAVGIHTTGGLTGNSGTRISEAVLQNLIRWIGG